MFEKRQKVLLHVIQNWNHMTHSKPFIVTIKEIYWPILSQNSTEHHTTKKIISLTFVKLKCLKSAKKSYFMFEQVFEEKA